MSGTVLVVERGPELWCRIPFDIKEAIDVALPWPNQEWSREYQMSTFDASHLPTLTWTLARRGYSVDLVREADAPAVRRPWRTWAVGMFAVLPPELVEQTYQALATVLGSAEGHHGRLREQLDHARESVHLLAVAR